MATILIEAAYLAAAAALTAYPVASLANLYAIYTRSHPLFPSLSPFLSLWLLPPAVLAQRICSRAYRHTRKARLLGCRPPNAKPSRDPILGSDVLREMLEAMAGHRVLSLWDEWFSAYGDAFSISTFGMTTYFINSPENIRAVLSRDIESFPILGRRQVASTIMVGWHSVLSLNGKAWQEARAVIRPTFVRNQMSDLACMDRHVENFLAKIPRDGSTIDLQKLFHLLTMDTSTDFMFGQSTNTLTNPSKDALEFIDAFEYAAAEAATIARRGRFAEYLPNREFRRAIKVVNSFAERFIEDALAKEEAPERSYIFLDELAKTGAGPAQIRDQILGLILGGRDTTASALSSLFWILARRPDVVGKLRDEISQLEGRKPTWEELKGMRYLNFVIKEVLRLYPPVAAGSREAARDTVLPVGGGPDGRSPLFVPKGTTIRYSLYTLHRRQDIFGLGADEFRPERWETLRASWEFLPFSGGPRICIGQQLALTQLVYTIVRMLQTFETVDARDDAPMELGLGLTISLPNGCHVAFTPSQV